MRAWSNLHNPPACSSFKTVAGAKFELACQTSKPKQRSRQVIEDAIQTRCGQCQFQQSEQCPFGCGHPTSPRSGPIFRPNLQSADPTLSLRPGLVRYQAHLYDHRAPASWGQYMHELLWRGVVCGLSDRGFHKAFTTSNQVHTVWSTSKATP